MRLTENAKRPEMPEELVHRIAPTPLLVVHGEDDHLIALDEALRLFEEAGEPKRLLLAKRFGHAAAERALQQKRVRELYITHRFLEEHTRHAEDAVRDAIDQGATVEEVERGAAERLDKHGGIAARLRYRLNVPEPPRAEARVHL